MLQFYIDKTTSTFADTLTAFGLAKLIDMLTEDQDNPLTIHDDGNCYRLEVTQPLQTDRLESVDYFHLYPGLDTQKNKTDLPTGQTIDYTARQQANQAYFDARKLDKDETNLRALNLTPPPPDWPVWAAVNQMSAINAYNSLAQLWFSHRTCFADLVCIILSLYTSRPNNFQKAEADWKALAQAQDINSKGQAAQLQIINPGMGKGANRSKADKLSIGGLSGFWIPEYLKFAGMYQSSIPKIVRGSKDRKMYVLRPKSIRWTTHKEVYSKFQSVFQFSNSSAKMDILAVLRYCEVFIEQWKEGQTDQKGWGFFEKGAPSGHVAGIDVVFYKHLGSAVAAMNMSTLILPEWLPAVETIKQADQFLSLITEHQDIVRSLDAKNEGRIFDEVELLRIYRDFLSARDLRIFFEFTRGYSTFVMKRLIDRGSSPRQFTISNLEVLLMAHDKKLEPILKNPGFLNIAEAIRRSTVIPQYQKARGSDSLYQIRYGLGDRLLRHAQYGAEFMEALSGFMHDYNRENATKSETRNKQFRSNITVEDIQDIVSLVDAYGASTVANLLVAYGYARDPKLGQGKDSPSESDPEIDETDGDQNDESLPEE